jgi:tetratricopeptide (TPR) repeat protein/tRNA A-37 threonylcarbamoyl transferase component Bud32
LSWLNHGPYRMKGVEEPMEICEVGEVGMSVLVRPPDSEKAHRHISADSEPVLGWRPAIGQKVPNTQWVLERELGAGGFGEVWLGRHETLKERRVFKFCFHADRVRSLKREVTFFRLLKERGNHPNIVGVQDVFFDEAPFYIMMDYAAGEDLGKWAAQQGGLEKVPLESRLEIVAQLADALQAAHEAGIIHRDVKPSNVIVCGSEPGHLQVKLTDFGIGQLVSKDVLARVTQMGFTQTTSVSSDTGTPLYMAPELLAGKPASTRSDIYSLGVVLYQLLVGDLTRPPTMDWSKEIESPLLKEDLSKCLAGHPQERFAAAQELAQRLRTLPERRLALTRREAEIAEKVRVAHRKGVMKATAIATGVILLMAGLALDAFYQAREARTKKKEAEAAKILAEQRLAESEAISKFLTEVFQSPDPARDGRTIKVVDILGAAAKKLDTELTNQPERRAILQATLGSTYRALGLYPEAISLREKVRDHYLAASGLENTDTLDAMHNLATSYDEAGRFNDALKLREEVLPLRRKLNGPEHPSTLMAMNNLATSYNHVGRRDEALKLREEVLALQRKVNGPENLDTITAMQNLANSYYEEDRSSEALNLREKVLALRRKLLGPEQPDTLQAMNNLANSYDQAGRRDEALKLREEVLTLRSKGMGPEHPDTLKAMYNLAHGYRDAGRKVEALKLLEEVLPLRRKVLGAEHSDTLWTMNDLALSYDEAGRHDEALGMLEQVLAIRRKVNGPDSTTLLAMMNLATSYHEVGKFDQAVKLREEILALISNGFGPEHLYTFTAMNLLANCYDEAGRRDDALKLREKVLALRRKVLSPEHPDTLMTMNDLATSYDETGRHDEALTMREQVLALRRKVLGPEHPDTLTTMNDLAWTLATSNASEIRNGTNAVNLAEEAVAATHRTNAVFLGTLAAAYAETHQFDKAVGVQQEAMGMAKNEPEKKDYSSRLKLYQANKPCRAQDKP